MLFSTLASLFVAVAAASTAEDKWSPRGCNKPCHSSSSSSSSSRHCPQSGCPPKHARKIVKELMTEFNAKVVACDYLGAAAMARVTASTSIIEPGCEPLQCCVRNAGLTDFLSRYTCGDELQFFQPTEDNIRMFANGTVVYSQQVLNIPTADPTVMNAYQYNYHWTPVYGCNYQLTYVDGNSLKCPNYVFELPECALCT